MKTDLGKGQICSTINELYEVDQALMSIQLCKSWPRVQQNVAVC